MTGRIEGKVALIVGAARGIGKGIALRFAEEGARLVLADSEAEAGQATADELGAAFIAHRHLADGRCRGRRGACGRAPRPARHHRPERRHLSLAADREHQPRRLGPRHGRQSARHLQCRARRAGADEGASASGACCSPRRSPGRMSPAPATATTRPARPASTASSARPRSSFPATASTSTASSPATS